jgi:hypothetical protein
VNKLYAIIDETRTTKPRAQAACNDFLASLLPEIDRSLGIAPETPAAEPAAGESPEKKPSSDAAPAGKPSGAAVGGDRIGQLR